MSYDFETLVDRSGQGAGKWDAMREGRPELPKDIVPFSVADMEFKTAPEIVDGLKKYLDTHILGYTSPTEEYRSTVCRWMKEQHQWDVTPESICCTSGVVSARYLLVAALTQEKDGVILMPPVYYPFYSAVTALGREVKKCPLLYENGAYSINFELLEQVAAESSSKLLIFCSPHNPVGRVWKKEELRNVWEICKKHGVRIISDEIHFDIILPGHTHTVFQNAVDCKEEVVVCTAPSKTFNLAAMQTSNIIIPLEEDRKKLQAVRDRIAYHDPNALGLEACRLAYTLGKPWMEEMREAVSGNYRFAVEFLKKHLPEIKPIELQGTYLLWLDCTALGKTKEELESFMVNDAQLFLDEGYLFGEEGSGFERVNLACPQWVLKAGLERLERAFKK